MRYFILLVLLTVAAFFVSANNPAADYKFHSIYVYNFTKYIEWPTHETEFKIFILGGDANIKTSFESMAETKSVGGSKIVVKQYPNINNLPMECNILFIPQSDSHLANRAIERYKGKNTLVITERSGMIDSGSCINFILVENRLKFEISKAAIDQAGLKVSNQLLQMGIAK
jgi:hypothetical protein